MFDRATYNAQYHAEHKATINARSLRYYHKYKKKLLAGRKDYMKKYYKKHCDKWSERHRPGTAANDERNAQRRARYAVDPQMQKTARAQSRKWYWSNPDKAKARMLRQYNITLERFNELLKNQGNACAICGRNSTDKRVFPHVDHCHETNAVRGLLCTNCNFLIGHAGDDPAILRKAASYLSKRRPHG